MGFFSLCNSSGYLFKNYIQVVCIYLAFLDIKTDTRRSATYKCELVWVRRSNWPKGIKPDRA